MAARILLMLGLILATAVAAGAAAVAAEPAPEFRILHATWNDPASTKPAVALADIPAGVEACFWTGTDSRVWPNPPTSRQVQAVANLAVNGGPNPYKPISAGTDVDPYPAGTFVLLDGEGRTDAQVERFVNQYKSYGGGRVPFGVYAFAHLPDGAVEWRASDNLYFAADCEARAAAVGRVAAKIPVLVDQAYLEDNKPDDRQFLAWDFDLATTRRLYPGRPVYVITRGDRIVYRTGPDGQAARNPDGTYATSTTPLTDAELWRLAAWARARFDGVIVWGVRADNVALLRTLSDVDARARARRGQ